MPPACRTPGVSRARPRVMPCCHAATSCHLTRGHGLQVTRDRVLSMRSASKAELDEWVVGIRAVQARAMPQDTLLGCRTPVPVPGTRGW